MLSRSAIATIALTAIITVAGCSSSADSSAPTTTALTTTTTNTTAAPTTTTPAVATVGFPSGAAAANELVEAWNGKDRPRAEKVADAEAVNGIFAVPDPALWLRGCNIDDEQLGEGGCIYRSETGAITINTEKRDIGWVVATADWGPNTEGVTD